MALESTGRQRRGEAGLTIIEMSVVLFLLSVVGLMFFQLYVGTLRTTMELESRNDLSVLGQRTVNDLRTELMQTRSVMQNDLIGQSYITTVTLDTVNNPVFGGSRLPTVDPTGIIEPDTGSDDLVGNSLFLARQLDPLSVWINHDGDSNTPNVEFLADRYQFHYYYLTQRNTRDFDGNGFYLDLVRARSAVYADYFQLSGLDLTVRTSVHQQLSGEGITFAWDPGKERNDAFYRVNTTGALQKRANHKPDLSSDVVSMLPELAGGRVSGNMTYSVGLNGTTVDQGSVVPNVMGVQAGQFPAGFESLIVGPSGSRKVYMRLAIFSEQAGIISGHVNQVIVSNADF